MRKTISDHSSTEVLGENDSLPSSQKLQKNGKSFSPSDRKTSQESLGKPLLDHVIPEKRQEKIVSTDKASFDRMVHDFQKLNQLINSLASQKFSLLEEKSSLVSDRMSHSNDVTDLEQNNNFNQTIIRPEKLPSSSQRIYQPVCSVLKTSCDPPSQMPSIKEKPLPLVPSTFREEELKKNDQVKLKSGFFCSKPPDPKNIR